MSITNDTTTSSVLAESTDDQVLDELGRRRKAPTAQEQADLQALRDELRPAHLAAETAQLRQLYPEVAEEHPDDDAFRAAVTEHQVTARRKYRELLGDDALTDLVAREEGFAGDWSFDEGMEEMSLWYAARDAEAAVEKAQQDVRRLKAQAEREQDWAAGTMWMSETCRVPGVVTRPGDGRVEVTAAGAAPRRSGTSSCCGS